jgi:hypothetical protein
MNHRPKRKRRPFNNLLEKRNPRPSRVAEFTLPLRIHKRTEIRSDLKKEKSKTGRRGCRHNKREKL